VIEMRRAQLSFGDGLIAAEIEDLQEGWTRYSDQVLSDEEIIAAVYESLGQTPGDGARGVRLQIDYLKPALLLEEFEVRQTIVVVAACQVLSRDLGHRPPPDCPPRRFLLRRGHHLRPKHLEQFH
jgi:hypothetical protein